MQASPSVTSFHISRDTTAQSKDSRLRPLWCHAAHHPVPVVRFCSEHIPKASVPHAPLQVVTVVFVGPGFSRFHEAEYNWGQVLDGLGPVVWGG
jgi:hypothetical protein